jgi:hypothetical protein
MSDKSDSGKKTADAEVSVVHSAWDVPMHTGREGTGNWDAFEYDAALVQTAAARWKQELGKVEYPWLCWNIDDEWCALQQRLVLAIGWTPVVGWDPNVSPRERTVMPGAIEIDFNEEFAFPALWSHFPLEFAFLWTERLAFWHADLLLRIDKMRALGEQFANIADGEMAAVRSLGGVRRLLRFREHRYWELIGLTTAAASRDQFDNGCGWWRHFYRHPNTPVADEKRRRKHYYDSGVGIMYWKRHCGGRVHSIAERYVAEGHCTEIGKKNYVKASSKAEELRLNYNVADVARSLGLEAYL